MKTIYIQKMDKPKVAIRKIRIDQIRVRGVRLCGCRWHQCQYLEKNKKKAEEFYRDSSGKCEFCVHAQYSS